MEKAGQKEERVYEGFGIFSLQNQEGNTVWVLLLFVALGRAEGLVSVAHFPRLLLFHGDQCII